MKKKFVSLLTATAVIATSLAGCGQGGGSQETTKAPETQAPAQSAESGGAAQSAEFAYPMAAGAKLTYWAPLNDNVSANYSNLGDTFFGKALMAQTGVDIEFMHPPLNQHVEQFSLILADGNLPDVMEYDWLPLYAGGPEKAITDGVILPLNDIIEQYCPNLSKYLAENPDIDRMIQTDEGNYYCFPFIRGDEKLCNTIGPMLRKDWLDELGLEVPTTIDEWHTVLTAFKEQKGATAPFTYEQDREQLRDTDPFAYAYNTTRTFYLGSDGKVHYGAAEPEFKDYLATMAQWYKEGLIDADLATLSVDQVSAKMTSGTAGASVGWAGSRLGAWTKAAQATNPDYELVATPYPTTQKGAYPEFGQIENQYSGRASVAITTSCKDIESAARMLDYAYGENGHFLYNFGVEGESYHMVDGYPTYTDLILDNPDGLPISQAMAAYIRGCYNGPFVQDLRYLEQYYTLQNQKDTPDIWGASNGKAHAVPPITPTTEESKEYSTIMNEVKTYRDEMILKFIFGTESIDNFDTYIANMEKMGLGRALEIQNAALDRYNAR